MKGQRSQQRAPEAPGLFRDHEVFETHRVQHTQNEQQRNQQGRDPRKTQFIEGARIET